MLVIFEHPRGWRILSPSRARLSQVAGDASRDEFARPDSAANPLDRAGIDPKLLSDLAHARPPRNRESLPDALFQVGSYPRPSEPFPFALGPR